MLGCLNEHRSRGVKTFPMAEWLCEGAKGNSRNNFIENPEDASVFLHNASSEKSASTNFLEFLLSTVLLYGKESIALWVQTKITCRKPLEGRQ